MAQNKVVPCDQLSLCSGWPSAFCVCNQVSGNCPNVDYIDPVTGLVVPLQGVYQIVGGFSGIAPEGATNGGDNGCSDSFIFSQKSVSFSLNIPDGTGQLYIAAGVQISSLTQPEGPECDSCGGQLGNCDHVIGAGFVSGTHPEPIDCPLCNEADSRSYGVTADGTVTLANGVTYQDAFGFGANVLDGPLPVVSDMLFGQVTCGSHGNSRNKLIILPAIFNTFEGFDYNPKPSDFSNFSINFTLDGAITIQETWHAFPDDAVGNCIPWTPCVMSISGTPYTVGAVGIGIYWPAISSRRPNVCLNM